MKALNLTRTPTTKLEFPIFADNKILLLAFSYPILTQCNSDIFKHLSGSSDLSWGEAWNYIFSYYHGKFLELGEFFFFFNCSKIVER